MMDPPLTLSIMHAADQTATVDQQSLACGIRAAGMVENHRLRWIAAERAAPGTAGGCRRLAPAGGCAEACARWTSADSGIRPTARIVRSSAGAPSGAPLQVDDRAWLARGGSTPGAPALC